jgi:hypothetical protein
MKKAFILLILTFLFLASCDKQAQNTYLISEEAKYEITNDLIFVSKDSLNKFNDFALIDSFLITIDEYTDTVMRIYKNLDFSNPVFSALKGNGPRDILGSVLINNAVYYDTIIFFENDVNRIKKMQIIVTDKFGDFKSEFFKGQGFSEFNTTKNYLSGLDISFRKIFIHNKISKENIDFGYFLDTYKDYDTHRLSSLHSCRLVLNEENQTICAAMFWVNSVYFFNLQGKIQKTIIIGDKLQFPKPHAVAVNFPDERIHFVGNCGTQDYVYCLYYGTKSDNSVSFVKIFIFNWEGEHITTIKTDGNIFKITADKNNEYLLGLAAEADWSSTCIVKIPLEGVLKSNINEL